MTDNHCKYLEMADEQNGFRKKQVCIAIHSVSTIIRTRMDKGKLTSACFVDYQKAHALKL